MEGVKSLTFPETRYFLGNCHIHLSQLTFTLCSKHARLLISVSQMSVWGGVRFEFESPPLLVCHTGHCDTCPILITYVTIFQSQYAVSVSSVSALPFFKVLSHTCSELEGRVLALRPGLVQWIILFL